MCGQRIIELVETGITDFYSGGARVQQMGVGNHTVKNIV